MKKIVKVLLSCAVAVSCTSQARVIPYISIRSQSENAARELVLWQTQINLDDMIHTYGSLSLTPEYEQTFYGEKIARALFNDALKKDHSKKECLYFNVQGSLVPNRDSQALLAENFGLPTDYSSVVTVAPKIKNFILDIDFYVGLDEWMPGWYVRIHTPIVHTVWDLGFCEKDINPGVNTYPLGYFNGTNYATTGNPYGVSRANLVDTFEDYIAHRRTPVIQGVTFDPLEKARVSECPLDDTKFGDIQCAVGWNFCTDECYHAGINIRGSIPIGTRPLGTYLFEPIIGNGKLWELGAGFTGHWMPWISCDGANNIALYLDANITHMFKSRQSRTFDFCDKPLSRYMLAETMTAPTDNLFDSADDRTRMAPMYQFNNEFSPVANLSTIPVDVGVAVQADIALKFAYTHCNYQFDIGYDFWARSCEEICPRCACIQPDSSWALKGDAFVYGFTFTPQGAIAQAVPLSASELDATIFCGTNNAQRTGALFWEQNPGIDNAKLAFNEDGEPLQNFVNETNTIVPIYSSFDPLVFSTNKFKQWDIKAAQTKGMSHKIFGNIGHICSINEHWSRYIGIGFEAELGHSDKRLNTAFITACTQKNPGDTTASLTSCCTNCCGSNTHDCKSNRCEQKRDCINFAVSQWGIWLKGGISFK